jgi:hypothetical protein
MKVVKFIRIVLVSVSRAFFLKLSDGLHILGNHSRTVLEFLFETKRQLQMQGTQHSSTTLKLLFEGTSRRSAESLVAALGVVQADISGQSTSGRYSD